MNSSLHLPRIFQKLCKAEKHRNNKNYITKKKVHLLRSLHFHHRDLVTHFPLVDRSGVAITWDLGSRATLEGKRVTSRLGRCPVSARARLAGMEWWRHCSWPAFFLMCLWWLCVRFNFTFFSGSFCFLWK